MCVKNNTIIYVARTSNSKSDCGAWSLLLIAATVRSFAQMPLGISDRNSIFLKIQHTFYHQKKSAVRHYFCKCRNLASGNQKHANSSWYHCLNASYRWITVKPLFERHLYLNATSNRTPLCTFSFLKHHAMHWSRIKHVARGKHALIMRLLRLRTWHSIKA